MVAGLGFRQAAGLEPEQQREGRDDQHAVSTNMTINDTTTARRGGTGQR